VVHNVSYSYTNQGEIYIEEKNRLAHHTYLIVAAWVSGSTLASIN